MNQNENTNMEPANTDGINFVRSELSIAQRNWKRAKWGGGIIAVLFFVYINVIGGLLHSWLQPEAASNIAAGFAAQQILPLADKASDLTKNKAQNLNQLAMDQLKTTIHSLRLQAEPKITNAVHQWLQTNEPALRIAINDYFRAHHEILTALTDVSNDPKRMAGLEAELKDTIDALVLLKKIPTADGPVSVADITQTSAQGLQFVAEWFDRLAKNKDLTTEEQQARRVIAGLLQHENSIGWYQSTPATTSAKQPTAKKVAITPAKKS